MRYTLLESIILTLIGAGVVFAMLMAYGYKTGAF